MADLGQIPRQVAADLLRDVGPVVTYCRVFAVGPPCAHPCAGCRLASCDLHRAAARTHDEETPCTTP